MERLNKQPLFTNRIHCNSSPYPSLPFVTLQKYGTNTQNISPDVPEHSPEFPDPYSKSETKPLQLFRHLCWPDPVPNDSTRNSETHCAASRDASGATSGPRRLRVTRRDQARRWFDDCSASRKAGCPEGCSACRSILAPAHAHPEPQTCWLQMFANLKNGSATTKKGSKV